VQFADRPRTRLRVAERLLGVARRREQVVELRGEGDVRRVFGLGLAADLLTTRAA